GRIGLTLDGRGEIGEREELVKGTEPRTRAAHLRLQVGRQILGRGRRRLRLALRIRRGLAASALSTALFPVLGGRGGNGRGGILGRRRRRRRRAEAGSGAEKVEEAPHVRQRTLLVVVLCPASTT
ncbi:hypothetical protein B296_00058318, partial [Ensete ventricosum]